MADQDCHISRRNPPGDNRTRPQHIAFIVDGNRRWAQARGLSIFEGHHCGAEKVLTALRWCQEAGIGTTTWWLLSTDNLNRPRGEVRDLFRIIDDLVRSIAHARAWRVQHLGAADLLPDWLNATLKSAERETQHLAPVANLAVGYGGRHELVAAIKAIVQKSAVAGQPFTEVTEDAISSALYTRGQPDPDLVVRTAGEERLSGFMVWQTALSELCFARVLWPDFDRADLNAALADFRQRHRRMGR